MSDFQPTTADITDAFHGVSEMISNVSGAVGEASEVVTDAAKKGQKLLADIFMLTGYLPTEGQVFIEGDVSPGFEQVKQLFEENFRKGFEKSAQLCVYVGEEKVIDIWGSVEFCSDFGPDTLVNIFSSSKNLTSIAMAKIVDAGLLSYDTNIEDIWPEFAANGKSGGKVSDLMRHELGIPTLNKAIAQDDILRKHIKQNKIGEIIEEQTFKDPPGSVREYHFFTRGWIANEIFRRAEPSGKTIGEFLRAEVSDKIGADAYIGLSEEQMENVGDLKIISPIFVALQALLPKQYRNIDSEIIIKTLQTVIAPLFLLFKKLTSAEEPVTGSCDPVTGIPLLRFDKLTDFFNSDQCRKGEIPSGNAHCSARGLSLIGAAMANRGTFKGVEILSRGAWDALHQKPKDGKMFGAFPTRFTQGGLNLYANPSLVPEGAGLNGRDGYVGWMGFGGSIFQWHPDYKIGFAYVPTLLDWTDLNNSKGLKLQKGVVECIQHRQRM